MKFELYQEIDGWRWAVTDADGVVIDSWARDLRYDDQRERMVGARTFKSEQEALAFLADTYPDAVDAHSYMSAERDAEIAAWADEVIAAAAAEQEG